MMKKRCALEDHIVDIAGQFMVEIIFNGNKGYIAMRKSITGKYLSGKDLSCSW
jgi:excinuclease UvrABC ATPase subunit